MNKQQKIKQLLKVVNANKEGFTISFNGLKPYKENVGFSIALTNIKGKNLKVLCKKVLSVGSVGFSQMINNLYIGGWYNQTDGFYYLDLSIIEKEQQNALYLKTKFNQLSIFDFKALSCI